MPPVAGPVTGTLHAEVLVGSGSDAKSVHQTFSINLVHGRVSGEIGANVVQYLFIVVPGIDGPIQVVVE